MRFFSQTKLPYLGHIIENGTLSLDPKRTKVIEGFPVPNVSKNLEDL